MSLIKRITRGNYYRKIFAEHKEDITSLCSVLEDEQSIETVKDLIRSYCTLWRAPEYYYRKAAAAPHTEHHFFTDDKYEVRGVNNPYFLEEIFDLERCQVFLDGGAYIGDTIEIAQEMFPNLRLVYAFEPNKETFQKLIGNQNIKGLDVRFFNNGLGSVEGKYHFLHDDAGSKICEDGSEVIDVLAAGDFISSLKEDELPDFIKLDIEGSEMDVLESLEPFIMTHKPDLAISIYHSLEDLWTIPLKIKGLCPEYHIYIRHQSNYYTETICYATTHSRKE